MALTSLQDKLSLTSVQPTGALSPRPMPEGFPHFGVVFSHCRSPLIARASRGPWFLFCPFEVLLDTLPHTWSRPDAQRSSGLLAGLAQCWFQEADLVHGAFLLNGEGIFHKVAGD